MNANTKIQTKPTAPKKTVAKKPTAKKPIAKKPEEKPEEKKLVTFLDIIYPKTNWDTKLKVGHKEAAEKQDGQQFCELYALAIMLKAKNQDLFSPTGDAFNLDDIIKKGDSVSNATMKKYKKFYLDILSVVFSGTLKDNIFKAKNSNGLQIISFCTYLQSNGYIVKAKA